MNRIRVIAAFACLFLLGCDPCCFAQLKAEATPIKLITGLTNPSLAGPYVLIDDKSTPQTMQGAIISVSTGDTKPNIISVDAETIPSLEPVDLVRIDSNNYLILTPGTHRVEVIASDPGFQRVRFKVTIGKAPTPPPGPGPGPDPGPAPDVGNAYNVGLPAYLNAPADTAGAQQYARIYRDAANFLYGIPSYKFIHSDKEPQARDPNRSVTAWLDQQLKQVQCRDVDTCKKWAEWRAKIGSAFVESQKAKTSYTREDWYQAFNEVAAALEKVKQ